jgi:3-oxoacyl-(acyl-carrier-protein) synthase
VIVTAVDPLIGTTIGGHYEIEALVGVGAIGRSNLPPSLDGFQQDPLSNRACRFPAHGLRVVSRDAALRNSWVLDGSVEAVQTEGVEIVP